MTRYEAYDAINDEREYQEFRWGKAGHEHGVGDYILFMQHYLDVARTNMTIDQTALNEVRKVAALAVACMEDNGISHRLPWRNNDRQD